MNAADYNKLLAQPQQCVPDDLGGLDLVISQFPFFQSAQALRLKILKQQASLSYNQALKKTAAVTTDRDVLFDYITSEEFSQQTISQTVLGHQEHVKNIEVNEVILEHQEDETTDNKSQPFEFNHNERHSFEQWLKLTSAKPIQRAQSKQDQIDSLDTPLSAAKEQDKWEKIDRFLAQKTSINPQQAQTNQNKAEAYLNSNQELMTETLARVYVQQKNYQKAIQAYKILILKYPEKSSFFADQIRELQGLLNA
jgi:hypothetical protein